MRTDQTKRHALATASFTRILLLGVLVSLLAPALFAADPEIFPLSQVKPGMKGEALTIFAGDQIEKFDLIVIGVMPNFLGPKQSIILVQRVCPRGSQQGRSLQDLPRARQAPKRSRRRNYSTCPRIGPHVWASREEPFSSRLIRRWYFQASTRQRSGNTQELSPDSAWPRRREVPRMRGPTIETSNRETWSARC